MVLSVEALQNMQYDHQIEFILKLLKKLLFFLQIFYQQLPNKFGADYMSEPNLLSFRCHIEGRTNLNYCSSIDKISTLGQDDVIVQLSSIQLTNRIKEIQIPQIQGLNNEEYVCMAYEYIDHQYILGTRSGKIIRVITDKIDSSRYVAQIVYDAKALITTINFSDNSTYLAIGNYGQESLILMKTSSLNQDRVISEQDLIFGDRGHEGAVLSVIMTRNQQYIGTIGTDGFIIIYRIQENTLKYLCKFKVLNNKTSKTLLLKQSINQNPQTEGHIVVAGSNILQEVWIVNQEIPEYQIKSQINENQCILSVIWVNSICLSIVTQSYVSIWNYRKSQRIVKLNSLAGILEIAADSKGLFCTKMDGILYRYDAHDMFKKIYKEKDKPENYEMDIEDNQKEQELGEQAQGVQDNRKNRPKRKKEQPKLSIAAELIKTFPQRQIQSSYEGYMENRFLYYNEYGCIIERTDGDTLLVQLEYHDKQKIHRIKFQSKNSLICHFALTKDVFAYSTLSHFYFEREITLYSNQSLANNRPKRQHFLQKWDLKWEGIEGITVGNGWVAVASKLEIKIFDFSGNQLHSLCYHKHCMKMAAYQDMLALVVHSTLPMYTTQLFQMKIYNVSLNSYKFQKTIKIPVNDNQTIKWFGFSHEGIIFMQQSSQDVKMYHWTRGQWLKMHAGNPTDSKIYIQHIENYEIFGFNIPVKEGEPNCPTVQPRSIPRRIQMIPNIDGLEFLTEQQNNRANLLYIRKMVYELEHFRISKWYKYKYSRGSNHPYFHKIAKIMTTEELQSSESQHDIQIIQYTKKIMQILQVNKDDRLGNCSLNEAKNKVLYLTSKLINYHATLVKLKQILGQDQSTDTHIFPISQNRIHPYNPYNFHHSTTKKYNQINRIVGMVDMGWANDQ